ncbi:MAG: hypothetical protein QM493_08730 [Sulfurovum sp.]
MTTIIIITSVLVILIIGLVIFLKSKNKNKIENNEEVIDKTPQRQQRPQARATRTPPPRTPPPPRREVKPEPRVETKPAKELPKGIYPKYDHSRMITDLGLTEDDAIEFIADLIGQMESTIPQIDSSINSKDYETMESLTHAIKGSATNLGTGGVADVLIDFNTYLKMGKDIDIINSYFGHLKKYSIQLKEQYA